MTTPELERVAMAIYGRDMAPFGSDARWIRGAMDDEAKARYVDIARAALLAIREPSDAMVAAIKYNICCSCGNVAGDVEDVEDAFRAAIDAPIFRVVARSIRAPIPATYQSRDSHRPTNRDSRARQRATCRTCQRKPSRRCRMRTAQASR